MIDPQTDEEWQEAVNLAGATRLLADCKMYGLLKGGPDVDVARCDELLDRGKARGIVPCESVAELAAEFARNYNNQIRAKIGA